MANYILVFAVKKKSRSCLICKKISYVRTDNNSKICQPCFVKHKLKHKGHYKSEIGKKYNFLEVIDFFSCEKKAFWICVCDCGNYAIVYGSRLRNNKTKSCGCLRSSQKI